jgi:hypothetical protein
MARLFSRAVRNAVVSSGVPAVTRRWCGRPTSRTRTPWSSSRCPGRLLVGEAAEEHEVRVARHRREAEPGQLGHDPVALLLDRLHGGEQGADVLDRRHRGRLL